MTEQREDRRISRRTITKGTAWSVPVVAVMGSASAQAQAVSGCVPTLDFSPDSCRCTGEGQNAKDYFVSVCNDGVICPDGGGDGVLYVSVRANTGAHPELAPGLVIEVPVGGCSGTVQFNSTNSSRNLRLYYGETQAAALAADNPNFVIVDAPADCETLEEPLGTCIKP
ncbi:hypothetical protein ACOCJ4_07430 [Knoellia sp. CPCC 206435]|uniref:hypothetical protein n=1 Tax=Knoellia terrae TaxID=3404797 RepID=UPI003B429953